MNLKGSQPLRGRRVAAALAVVALAGAAVARDRDDARAQGAPAATGRAPTVTAPAAGTAGTAGAMLAMLDADAPVVVRVDGPALAALAARLDRLPWPYSVAIEEGRRQLVGLLGADPVDWSAIGLDPGRPVVASLGSFDGADALALAGRSGPWLLDPAVTAPPPPKPTAAAAPARRATRPAPPSRRGAARARAAGPPPPSWRSRVVLPVADAATARAAVVAALGATWIRDAAAIARLLGATTAETRDVVARLGAHGVFAVTDTPLGGVAIARTAGGGGGTVIVIDLVAPALPRELRWRDDGALIERALATPKRPLVVASGPWRSLASPGLTVAVDLRRLADHGAWRAVLETSIGTDAAPVTGPSVDRSRALCGGVATVIATPFRHLAVQLTVAGDDLAVTADVGVAADSALAAVLASAADQGLPSAADVPDAALVARSLLTEPARLAGLPRPALAPGLPPVLYVDCDPTLMPLADLVSWPHRLGELAARLAAVEPRGALLVGAAGNAVLAVDRVAGDVDEVVAVVEVAVAPVAVAVLDPIIDHVWGASTTAASGATTWGGGRLRAFRREVGRTARVGVAVQAPSLDWWLAVAPPKPTLAPAGTILEVTARPAELALLLPATWAMVATAVPRLQAVASRSPDGVHIDARISLP